MGTNVLGPFLLTRLLEPILLKTAAEKRPRSSVRVVWVSSMLDIGTPRGGIVLDPQTNEPSVHSDMMANYMQSKAGVTFLGHEFAKRLGDEGIISTVSRPKLGVVVSANNALLVVAPRDDEDRITKKYASANAWSHGMKIKPSHLHNS